MKIAVSAALILMAFSVVTQAADSPSGAFFPYLQGDSLEALRDKITLNGGEFTVATNWVYNKTPEEKAAFFSRRPSAFPLLEGRGDDAGPIRDLTAPSEPYFSWTNYGGQAYIGPVRDQGDCGSCYAFGAAAAAEGTYNVAMNRTGANCVDFSESFIAWCLSTLPAYSSHFSGCDGADYEYAEVLALTVEGLTYETNFPYQETAPSSCTHWGDPRVTFTSWHRVPCNDIDAIKTAIRNYGVVDAAVEVTSAFEAYSGGIYSDANTGCSGSPCSETTTDHAISLVGWNDNGDPVNNGYWILRNSWGSSWGEGGYMRIKYKAAAVGCSVVYLVYSNAAPAPPVVSTEPATGITTNRAALNGTVNPQGRTTTYWFEYGLTTGYGSQTPALSAGSGSGAVAVSNVLSGLNPGATYNFRLVATNAGGRANGANRTFTTPAEPEPSDVLLSEGFENGGTLPSGWTMAYLSGSIPWTFRNGDGGYGHPSAAHGGSYNAFMYNESYTAYRTQLITPVINFGARTNQAALVFWHYMEEWCYSEVCDQDELRVYYKTSSGGSWNLLATYNANVTAWTRRILTLPNPGATYTIAFEGRPAYGYGICVDDVSVVGRLAPSRPDFNMPPQILPGASQFIIRWASEAGKAYTVFQSTNLLHGFSPLQTGLVATPFINSYTDSIPVAGQRYYKIEEFTAP